MKTRILCCLSLLAIVVVGALNGCGGITPVPSLTPTPEQLTVDAAILPYPQIVYQSPLPGERLGLRPIIELTFDRPMSQEKTSAAWAFSDSTGQLLKGETTWPDERTFQFKPDNALQAGETYRGIFTTDAISLAGETPPDEIRLDFRVTDALVVGQVFPLDRAKDVDRSTSITVIFNKPVIPLMTRSEQAKLQPPITIQPAVEGNGEWVSSSVYVFQPDAGLASGTKYTVRLRPSLKDTTGITLSDEYSWSFSTNAPQVVDFVLPDFGRGFSDAVEGVLLNQAFRVIFNQPMNQESVIQAITFVNIETGASVPVDLNWNEDSTALTLTPNRRLDIASFYSLSIASEAQAKDGGLLRERFAIKLSTLPLPAVSAVEPGKDKPEYFSALASVTFNTRMNFDSMSGRVQVSPTPVKPVRLFYREDSNRLDIFGLEPSTDYVIRILPGMTDIYGNAMQSQYSFSFQTAGLDSQANLLTPYYPLIFRPQSDQYLFFEHTNLESVDFSLYELPFSLFVPLADGNKDANAFRPGSTALRNWQPPISTIKDRFARTRLQLDEKEPLAPGYYFISFNAKAQQSNKSQRGGAIFIVANAHLTLKTTQTEALAWLIDSETGQPLPNVPLVFYDHNLKTVGKAVTNRDGLAYLPDAKSVSHARADDEIYVAMTSNSWGTGVSMGQFGVWVDYWTPVKDTFAYLYTERPLYRPDQPVYIKGILRESDDLQYSLPNIQQAYLSITNQQGEVFGGSVSISENGTFSAQYDLGTDAPVGNYSIEVRRSRSSETALGYSSFRVAEYVKPQFAVTSSATPGMILNGEQAVFALDAAYYSGGSLANAAVDWYLEAQPYFYTPPAEYSQYSFDDFDYYLDGDRFDAPPVRQSGQGQTDENGHFEMTETVALEKENTSQTVTFYANVTDVGGSLVGSSTSLTVLGSAVHAGIRPEQYVGKQGEAQDFNLVVLDRDGNPLPGQAVSVAFAEQRWHSVVRKDDNGVSRWDTSVQTVPAGNVSAVSDENGLATVSFTPPRGGQYKATITASDAEGRASKASAYLWVSSGDYVPWRQTNDRSFELIVDKDSYNPGDTAKILIAQPYDGANKALITIERGHIYEKKVVTLENNSTIYELPITSDMAPVMYVSVMVVKSADGETPPDFKMGVARVNINPSRQSIFVSLESDKKTARPGDAVTYTVRTKDVDGNPVQADVSLALVDKAVLALAPSVNPPLLEAFYPERGLGVITSSGLVLNAEDFNANYEEVIPDGEGSGGGGGIPSGIVTVRGDFKDTAYWQAQVLTDENGEAQVTVTLPDNLTTWQMEARAVTKDTRVGETTSDLLSTRPLQINLQTPRFFVVGDMATLGAVIHNNTDKNLEVKVDLQAEGLDLKSDAKQTVSVQARQQAYVTWKVAVQPNAQRVDLVASVESRDYQDSTRPTLGTLPGQGIPVLAYRVVETVGSSGVLRAAGSASEAIFLPQSQVSPDTSLNLEVSPSLAASIVDGLDYLKDYPYLCFEQTVSRFLPNLISLRALKLAGKATDAQQSALDAQIGPALQRIVSNQNADGGWGLWPGSESQTKATAYVVLGLLEAKNEGYTVPDSVLHAGLDYLENSLGTNFRSLKFWEQNRAAFTLYVLARGERSNANGINGLYQNRATLNVYAQALLMQAMHLDNPQDERLASLLSDISGAAEKSAAGASWTENQVDYWNWNTDTRSTAIVLNALMQVDPENALIPDAVRWLMKHRQGSHWYSTQETAWSLMALTNWLSLSGEFETDYQYALGLNGNLFEQGQASHERLTETIVLRLDVEKLLADTTNTLVIARGDGPGVLYYTAYMDYSIPVKDVSALDQGILVSRQYYHADDLKTPITETERGELVQVRVTLVVPESRYYVVLDDPLPAGLEAVDASLLTSQKVPSVYQSRDYQRNGWGWWYFYYKQIYDDRVVMSADYLPAGTYTITYLARASTVGEFQVLPVTAQQFYFPDVSGHSAGSVFTVK
ncbi:MAG: Ig-like domain-containing protein [Anaerolineae bacterium]|nr:Ig-like domain-containing protein [Anaerolineae bacterium]